MFTIAQHLQTLEMRLIPLSLNGRGWVMSNNITSPSSPPVKGGVSFNGAMIEIIHCKGGGVLKDLFSK